MTFPEYDFTALQTICLITYDAATKWWPGLELVTAGQDICLMIIHMQ